VLWADLSPTRGREQTGRRPVLVVSSDRYNETIPKVLVVVPITTRDRGLPHHVLLDRGDTNLPQPSYAMTEQPRTIDRDRIAGSAGRIDAATLAIVDGWLRDFLDLPAAGPRR
jgi:mRNA interferase MazF